MESLAGCAKTLTGRVPNHSPIPIAMHFLNLRELKYMEDNILTAVQGLFDIVHTLEPCGDELVKMTQANEEEEEMKENDQEEEDSLDQNQTQVTEAELEQ